MRYGIVVLFLLALCLTNSVLAQSTLIHAGRCIDGKSDQAREQVSIVIKDGKIERIADGWIAGTDDQTVIDLKAYTVMPGLMDMHTHLSGQMSKESYTEKFFMTEAEIALRSGMYAERTLLAGFTTVRDLGDNGVNTVALRKAINEDWIVEPRIYTATKSLATTGGHADPTNGLRGDFRRSGGPSEGVINSAEEARRAVRERYKDGADLIKLTATGGVLSLASSGDNPQFTMDELEAVVAAAKDYNFTVAVHAHGVEGMKRAVLAGVNSIEHGTYMTEEVMQLMKERGTYMVPTLMAGAFVAEKAKDPDYFPAVVRPKAAAIGPVIQSTFSRAYASGVNIAFGTDSGVSPHGDNAIEFTLMVAGGMPPMEAIQSATLQSAKLLRIEDKLGTLEPGKIADIVAVPGNPLENISVMGDVAFVMKDGRIFKQPK